MGNTTTAPTTASDLNISMNGVIGRRENKTYMYTKGSREEDDPFQPNNPLQPRSHQQITKYFAVTALR